MSESSRTQEHEPKLSATPSNSDHRLVRRSAESGRTLLVGILGGVVSAVGYAVYQRLPEDQRERVNEQVRGLVASRLNEFRSSFNL
jgi:hypothetical protein